VDTELAEEGKALSPEGLEGEEESPYLRRQKAVKVRRRQLTWGWRWVLFFTAVVAPVGITSYFLTTFALSSPRFELHSADDVQVTGNQFVSREEVANALGLPLHAGRGPGIKVFRLSLEAERKQVEAIAWVRSAALMRILPNCLVVHITERTPVAFTNAGGHVSLVDSDGVLLDKPENASFDLPVITGLDSIASLDECRTRIALYQDFMGQIGEEILHSGWMVSEADLADGDDLKALLVQGRDTLQVHFGHENFLEHFHTFLALLPELRKSNAPLDSVDLRYRNQVVVNPQGRTQPPAAGGAEAAQTLKE
jgi:cell division septal protein FtsQ